MTTLRYSAEELARLSGLSARTVRFYVAEGLLPEATGRGRGSHYTDDHLMRLVAVCEMKRAGLDLEQIRGLLEHASDLTWDDVEVWADPDWDSGRAEIPIWLQAWHERLVQRTGEAVKRGAVSSARRSAWTRVEIEPGVELHVSSEKTTPNPRVLERIAATVRRELAGG